MADEKRKQDWREELFRFVADRLADKSLARPIGLTDKRWAKMHDPLMALPATHSIWQDAVAHGFSEVVLERHHLDNDAVRHGVHNFLFDSYYLAKRMGVVPPERR